MEYFIGILLQVFFFFFFSPRLTLVGLEGDVPMEPVEQKGMNWYPPFAFLRHVIIPANCSSNAYGFYSYYR